MKAALTHIPYRTSRWLLSVLAVVLLTVVQGDSLCGSVCAASAQTNEEVVEQFFPGFLIEDSAREFANGGLAPFRASDFVVADLDGTGTEFIVAAYTNDFSAAIRVLRRQGTTTLLVDEPALRLLGGTFPFVKLIDLDNDGRPEVVTSFSSARGHLADWVFKWNGATLDLIGPSTVDEHGDVSTLLSEAGFRDLDGDGILEIINSPQQAPLAADEPELELGPIDIFRFDGDRYIFDRSLNFFGTFVRSEGKPIVTTQNFTVPRTDISYLVTIINGDGKGKNRVSSAIIRLNGDVVVGSSRLNQRIAEITEKVRLLNSNTLTVELRSAPGSQLSVLVAQEP